MEDSIYKIGSKLSFRNDNYNISIGTIINIVDINNEFISLDVKRDIDNKLFRVTRINTNSDNYDDKIVRSR